MLCIRTVPRHNIRLRPKVCYAFIVPMFRKPTKTLLRHFQHFEDMLLEYSK